MSDQGFDVLVTVQQVKKYIVYTLSTTYKPYDLAELKDTDANMANHEMTQQSEQRLIRRRSQEITTFSIGYARVMWPEKRF